MLTGNLIVINYDIALSISSYYTNWLGNYISFKRDIST